MKCKGRRGGGISGRQGGEVIFGQIYVFVVVFRRNSVDELKRGFRALDYKMQRVKGKADQAKYARESIELQEDKVINEQFLRANS